MERIGVRLDTSANTKLVYMDYQATTPCDERVLKKMLPYFTQYYGNPHSRNHAFGWDAEDGTKIAREQIAQAINASSKSIVFTSGATESNNLAIKGCARYLKEYGKNHIITTNTEHKCVIESVAALEKEGFSATYLKVQKDGLIDLKDLEGAISDKTALISVAAVHNEIGVIQPIDAIGEICEKHGIYFHTDAAQAIGKIPIDVVKSKIDLMSISGHKVYGPKGIGALFISPKHSRIKPRIRLKPIFSGGGQERGFRSGTLPPALCVGLGEAVALGEELRESEFKIYKEYFDYFVDYIQDNLEYVYLNGSRTQRVPHNANLSFRFVEGESLMVKVPEIAVSSGSACTSASLEPSYVLQALGVNEELAHTSLRFGFGRLLSKQDIESVANRIVESVKELREISPLYEMHQEGIDLNTIQWSGH